MSSVLEGNRRVAAAAHQGHGMMTAQARTRGVALKIKQYFENKERKKKDEVSKCVAQKGVLCVGVSARWVGGRLVGQVVG